MIARLIDFCGDDRHRGKQPAKQHDRQGAAEIAFYPAGAAPSRGLAGVHDKRLDFRKGAGITSPLSLFGRMATEDTESAEPTHGCFGVFGGDFCRFPVIFVRPSPCSTVSRSR
jgi:hypothetical protein